VTQPPKFEGGYNSVLVHYAQFVKELAAQKHANAADLNTPVVAALEKPKRPTPSWPKDHSRPRASWAFRPSAHGCGFIEIVERPATVTAVEFNAADKRIVAHKQPK
jgi:hypothetical protein